MALNVDDDKTLTALTRTMNHIAVEAHKLNVDAAEYGILIGELFQQKARTDAAKNAIAKAAQISPT